MKQDVDFTSETTLLDRSNYCSFGFEFYASKQKKNVCCALKRCLLFRVTRQPEMFLV